MARRQIDTFGVKPSGIFASWRYVAIFADDDGNITYEDVPGKPSINLDCLGDYKRNDRNRWQGDLITEYCNLTTFTNYRIYAQDCRPWAYVQTDLNAAKCGYLEPLPTPAVPPNPYGAAAYGEYKHFNACDDKGSPIFVKISKRNYAGVSGKLDYMSDTPIVISYKNTDDNKLTPIRPCECRITLTATIDFEHQEFYTEDEREYKVEVYKNGINKFVGYIIPDNASEEFIAPPYDVLIRATDGLGALKKVSYPVPVGSSIDIKQKFIDIIAYCLAMANLNLDIVTTCNLYEVKMSAGLDDDPLAQSSVNPLRMSDNGKIMNCYDILEKICLQFGAFLVQSNGAWRFTRQSELSSKVLRSRVYNYTALFLYSEQYNNLRVATCNGSDISILDASPTLKIGGAYKRAEVKVEFGNVPSIIYNGDFELWDGQNFNYWTRYGGIKISRVERTIRTTTGFLPIGNYALVFDEKADSGKYLEANPIPVEAGDRIKLSYNVGPTDTPMIVLPLTAYLFKMRIKVGQYYLFNAGNGNTYTWETQLRTCSNFIQNNNGDYGNYTVNFDIPAAPVSGQMIIELFGFQKIENRYIPLYVGTGLNPTVIQAHYEWTEINDYTPVGIDNIAISKTSEVEKKVVDSVLNISQQDGFYTKTPEQVKLLFGDFNSQSIAIQSNLDFTTIVNNLYAIYTADGSYSTAWYEFGASSVGLPIGLMAAKAILKAYQRSFRFLSSTFKGSEILYQDVFNVQLPNNASFALRTFALLSGDYNLMTDEIENANYAEIFEKYPKSIDISVPSYPGDSSPPITQNPNPPIPTTGIFTEEFTPQFL